VCGVWFFVCGVGVWFVCVCGVCVVCVVCVCVCVVCGLQFYIIVV